MTVDDNPSSHPPDPYHDRASCCPCPEPVVELLALAVAYAEASLPPEQAKGAWYVKTFMEQPAEAWCAYVTLPKAEA